MPEARDRLERAVDYAALFLNRRSNGILIDEPTTRQFNTGRGNNYGIRRRVQQRLSNGRENNNTSLGVIRRGRARAPTTTSVLPSWYPRTPFRDISTVVRAMERRRARMGEGVGRDIETPTPHQLGVVDTLVQLSGAQLEHDYSMVTPGPSVGFKRPWPPSAAKVHKILLDITRENTGEGEGFLTPQKKLLNSIDKVERVVMEEIQKMKSTPSAKRAEREKRVRMLMSMR